MAGIQRIADSFGVTPRHVQRLATEGMPKAARGNYDEIACLRWYVKYLQDKMAAGAVGDGEGLSGRERLANAKAEREEFNLAIDRKQLLTVADWEKATSDLIVPARHELLAIRPRLRPIIGAEAADRVGAEIVRSLRGLGEPQQEPS